MRFSWPFSQGPDKVDNGIALLIMKESLSGVQWLFVTRSLGFWSYGASGAIRWLMPSFKLRPTSRTLSLQTDLHSLPALSPRGILLG